MIHFTFQKPKYTRVCQKLPGILQKSMLYLFPLLFSRKLAPETKPFLTFPLGCHKGLADLHPITSQDKGSLHQPRLSGSSHLSNRRF